MLCSFCCALIFCFLDFHGFFWTNYMMPPFISCLKLNPLKLKTDDVWKEYQESAVPGSNVKKFQGWKTHRQRGVWSRKTGRESDTHRYTIITHDDQHCPWTVNVEILLFFSLRNIKFTRCGNKNLLDSECRVSCPCGYLCVSWFNELHLRKHHSMITPSAQRCSVSEKRQISLR